MSISFNEIKNNMDAITERLKKALDDGDYGLASTIANDVFFRYRTTYGIELQDQEEFDHIFHELINKMNEELKNFRPAPRETKKYLKFIDGFDKVANGIFKVAEVRKKVMEIDPTAEELVQGYEQGIKEATEHKAKLEKRQEIFIDLRKEIFGDSEKDLKANVDEKQQFLQRLKAITESVQEINDLQETAEQLEADILADPSLESRHRGNIDENNRIIKETLESLKQELKDLNDDGLDVSSIRKILNADTLERKKALISANVLSMKLRGEMTAGYREIIKRVKDAKIAHPEIDILQDIDLNGLDPRKSADRQLIDKKLEPLDDMLKRYKKAIRLQENYISTYTKSIEDVREEQKIIQTGVRKREDMAFSIPSDIKDKIEEEKAYYKQDEYDKMYGDPEKARKYKIYLKALEDSIVSKSFVLRKTNGDDILNTDGTQKTGIFKTIDYAEFERKLAGHHTSIEEALKLLQLEEYKERLERVTKVKSGDKFVLREIKGFEEHENARTEAERREALNKINTELDKDLVYIKTNNQASNTHEFMAKAIGDAGSLVKFKNGTKSLKEQDTFMGKLGAIAYNYASWIGLKQPSDARTVLGKVGYTVMDAALIAASPITVTTKALYRYTPVIGKEAQKRRYEQKYAGENSSPYDGRADARKLKRREKYKEEMKGPFKGVRSFVKATNDDLFNKKRRSKTETEIIEDYFKTKLEPSIEERYLSGAEKAETEKLQKAQENMELRKQVVREIAASEYAYNDLSREPEEVDEDVFASRSIQGSALELGNMESEKLQYSDSTRLRDTRHRKITTVLGALHGDLKADQIDFSKPQGSVANTDAIGRQTRKEAIEKGRTARNYLPYMLTAFLVGNAARYAVSRIKTTFEEVIPEETGVKTEEFTTTKDKVTYEKVQMGTREQVNIEEMPSTPRDMRQAFDNMKGEVHRSVWGGEKGGWQDYAFDDLDHTTGFYVEVQNAEGGIERISIAIPADDGKFEYLGTLANEYGLKPEELSKYIDTATGSFKPDADLYDLTAKILNNKESFKGMTGDKLKEMIATNANCKSYVHLVSEEGGSYGGWVEATTGYQVKVEEVPIFKRVPRVEKVPVIETREVPYTIPEQRVETIDVAKESLKKKADTVLKGMTAVTGAEATVSALNGSKNKKKRDNRGEER